MLGARDTKTKNKTKPQNHSCPQGAYILLMNFSISNLERGRDFWSHLFWPLILQKRKLKAKEDLLKATQVESIRHTGIEPRTIDFKDTVYATILSFSCFLRRIKIIRNPMGNGKTKNIGFRMLPVMIFSKKGHERFFQGQIYLENKRQQMENQSGTLVLLRHYKNHRKAFRALDWFSVGDWC